VLTSRIQVCLKADVLLCGTSSKHYSNRIRYLLVFSAKFALTDGVGKGVGVTSAPSIRSSNHNTNFSSQTLSPPIKLENVSSTESHSLNFWIRLDTGCPPFRGAQLSAEVVLGTSSLSEGWPLCTTSFFIQPGSAEFDAVWVLCGFNCILSCEYN
jgi:hypothetical protein